MVDVGAMTWAQRARRRKVESRRWTAVVALLFLVEFLAAALCVWYAVHPRGQSGTRVIDAGDLSAEEAQALVDEQVEKSRITVSLAPSPELDGEDGSLRVNFAVVGDNNGFSERFQIEQDHKIIYASEVIEPDHMVEWVHVPQAHPGKAIATVYAVDGESGQDQGNPVSVELELVERAA